MVRVTAPFPSVAIGLIGGDVSAMIGAGASSIVTIEVVVGSAGMFSSSSCRETGDTMLPSETRIVGVVAGGVMVGAVGTVVVGIVAGMGGRVTTGMEVGWVAIGMVMVDTAAGTLAEVVESIGGRLGAGSSVGCVELSSFDTERTLPVLAFFDIWPTESLRRLACIDDVSENSLFTSTSGR